MNRIAPLVMLLFANPCFAEQAISLKPVPVDSGAVKLTPANTRIDFVGTHQGEPKPRKGGFTKFVGEAMLDGSELKSIEFEFDTASLWTEFEKLTNHLKSADFFDIQKFPHAKFISTKIEPGQVEGSLNITGDFTLLGTTKPITVPVMLLSASNGMTLSSEFKFDRTEFGMTFGTAMIQEEVALKVLVGSPTTGKP